MKYKRQPFAIDVKGGGRTSRRKNRKTGRASNKKKRKQTEKVDCCHQCQRGRLLEMLSLMAKEKALKHNEGNGGSKEANEGRGRATEVAEAARRMSKCNSHRSTVKNRYRKAEIEVESRYIILGIT